ncbi:MAG TPA: LemA family protein [Polyangia bacterium]|jgi:LemA protein|nr:LemA family protein [Polyangia bacterium]
MYASFGFVGVVLLFSAYAVAVYNRLVTLRNLLRNAFSQIDVQLKRRHDLIPNLVETAKGYLAHEHQTLADVIAARNQAVAASRVAAKNPVDSSALQGMAAAEAALSGTVGRLLAVSEAYPDLKANQTMAALTEELTSTENKIAFARQAFNDDVAIYNVALERFPATLLAGSFGFDEAALWEIENAEEREPVRVAFG